MTLLRVGVAAVVLAGCGSDPRDCTLPAVLDDYAAGLTLDDCGSVYDDGVGGADTAAWQAAQTCALDHAQQHRAFMVRWTVQGIEGPSSGAFVGAVNDGQWTVAAFGQSARADGTLPPTRRDTCTDLQVTSACYSVTTNLCIECIGRATADQCTP